MAQDEIPPETVQPERGPEVSVRAIVLYTVAMAVLAVTAFTVLLLYLPAVRPGAADASGEAGLTAVFVMTTGVMFLAGALGGCLYNLRGLTKHTAAADFDPNYLLSYYVRPFSGGVSGLIVFFLLLGGALTLNVGASNQGPGAAVPSWATLIGRMPYIALSLLAGYGSHEFMLKLKDLADSVFALGRKE